MDALPPPEKRKIRVRRVLGIEGPEGECIVDCELHDWPLLEDCVACPWFRGYSLDPTGASSYVACLWKRNGGSGRGPDENAAPS